MVKKYLVADWLMGDSLKQDQFNFHYECCKIIFDSVLREKLLAEDKIIMETVIPEMIAFKSIMAIRDIQKTKAAELLKVKEKKAKNDEILKKNPKILLAKKAKAAAPKEEKSKSPGKSKSPSKSPEKKKESKSPGKEKKKKSKEAEEPEEIVEEKDPLEMTEEELYLKKLSDEANVDLMFLSEGEKQKKIEEAERKKYGRYWIWEGYYNEKKMDLWLDTAEALKHVNDQVNEDIEDSILLKAFKGVSEAKVQKMIDDDQKERLLNEKKLKKNNADEWYKQA